MSKWYKVDTISYKTILVEVANDECDEDAYAIASCECNFDSAMCEEIDTDDLECHKRHADEVISL